MKKISCFSGCLILILIFSTGSVHSFDNLSNIVKITNPNVLIKPPVNFSWLPESNKVYEHPDLNDLHVSELIQETIVKTLSENGYLSDSTSFVETTFSNRDSRDRQSHPRDAVLIKSWEWSGPSFGAGGIIKEITLENRGDQDVTNIRIRIDYLGTAGPKQGYGGPNSIFVIDGILPAKSEKTFRDINIGFRHPDSREENLRVLGVNTIVGDLLIGFTLVEENELSDALVDWAYGIIRVQSEESKTTNEYEKGTLIIDIIDAKNRILVWRGASRAIHNFDLPDEKKINRIKLSVEKLIQDFILTNK